MNIYTAHTAPHAAPVLLREGFSWGAFLFGPLWLLAHRCWIAGMLLACAWVGVALVPEAAPRLLIAAGLAWSAGLGGQDARRWGLARRGYVLPHVVAAADPDMALARLLDRRPDLIADALR